MGVAPSLHSACCLPARSPLDVYRLAEDISRQRDEVFTSRDLPYARAELALDAAGWPGVLGRWTPASVQALPVPVTVITAGGVDGGTAGARRGDAHHLAPDTPGLNDELARRLPAAGVSVLQLAYARPGGHRFGECASDVARAAEMAARRGDFLILLGHSMGAAVVLAACVGLPADRILGVCTLATQTRGVPHASDLGVLQSAGLLVVHGTADKRLPPTCSQEVWQRLPVGDGQQGSDRRFVLLDDTGHHLMERGEEVTEMVHEWILEVCLSRVAKMTAQRHSSLECGKGDNC